MTSFKGNLEGVDKAFVVLQIRSLAQVDRVEAFKLKDDSGKPSGLIKGIGAGAVFIGDCREEVYSVTHGIDIHHRTTTYDGVPATTAEYIGEQPQNILFILRGGVIFIETEGGDEMVRDSGKFLGGGTGGSYRKVTEKLTRVSGNYFSSDGSRQFYGECCLAGGGRPGDDNQAVHAFSLTMRAISTITSRAFSIEGMGTNSKRPWKLRPPAKMLGQGSPLKESCAPSVPPRIG